MTLAGFTPLMSNPQDPCYAEKTEDMVGHLLCINILRTDAIIKYSCGIFIKSLIKKFSYGEVPKTLSTL